MAHAFRLTRVLALQRQLRTLRQREAEALAETSVALATRIRSLEETRVCAAADEARAAAAGLLTPATLQVGRAYDAALADDQRRCHADAQRVDEALASKRTELRETRREERKLERLEDAHRRRRDEEQARADAALLDELAILRHARTRRRSDDAEDA